MKEETEESAPCSIVVDTNVIVAALRSKRGASNDLLRMAGDPRWRLNLSTPLLLEYEEQALLARRETAYSVEDIREFLDFLLSVSSRWPIRGRRRPVLPDPDDEMLLELALECGAAFIVSFNKRDLAPCEQFGIKVVAPGEFLKMMEE